MDVTTFLFTLIGGDKYNIVCNVMKGFWIFALGSNVYRLNKASVERAI